MLLYPDLNFGEGYLDGSLEDEGALVRWLEAQARIRLRARKERPAAVLCGSFI